MCVRLGVALRVVRGALVCPHIPHTRTLHADARPWGLPEQQEKNEAEKFKQEAAITRSATAQQVADIENQAWLVNRRAEAEANKIRALAQVRWFKRA